MKVEQSMPAEKLKINSTMIMGLILSIGILENLLFDCVTLSEFSPGLPVKTAWLNDNDKKEITCFIWM